MPVGVTLPVVIDVVPVPEHAVIVEHSVLKLMVAVPETILVPRHCGIAVGLQDSVTVVACEVAEHAVIVPQETVEVCVEFPDTK